MATRPEILAELGAAFRRDKVPPETFALYLRHVADIPEDVLQAAVDELIRTGDYFPTVRAIRAAAAEHVLDLPTEAAALAQISGRMDWARANDADQGDPPAVHPLVRQALDLVGGYTAFRSTDVPGVIRSQFLRLYKDLRAGAVHEVQAAPALPAGPFRVGLPPAHDGPR